jgi:hypothetical protein
MEGDDVGSDPLLSEKDGEEMAGDVGGVPFVCLSGKDFEFRNVTGFSLLLRTKVFDWRPSSTCHFAPFCNQSRVTGRGEQCSDAVRMLEAVICCDIAPFPWHAHPCDIDLFEICDRFRFLLDLFRELHEFVLAVLIGLAITFVLVGQCMHAHTYQIHLCTQCKCMRRRAL